MKKNVLWIGLCFLALCGVLGCGAEEGEEYSLDVEHRVISISMEEVLQKDFQGFGVEWDPHAESMVLDSDWKLLTERVDFLQPQIVRCMVLARWYISSIEEGEPKLDFDNYEMRQAFKVLNYCQEKGIDVIWGDWGPPVNLGVAFDDPAWAKAMARCLDYLRNEKGYTCIRYCNMGNEPDGSWSDCGNYETYKRAVELLHQEMKTLDLTEDIIISGPDVYGDWNWIDKAAVELSDVLGNFDFHWYTKAINAAAGNVELQLQKEFREIEKYLVGRNVFINEIGLEDGKTAADQQPNVKEFWYGVSIADFNVQCVRAGIAGIIAWDLEDSMHPTGKEYKTWGFWNIKGSEEEKQLRPWYYSYSLLSRLFPRGCSIMKTEDNTDSGIRVLAMSDEKGNISIAIVNNHSSSETFLLRVEGTTAEKLYQYNYFENDRRVDEKGFPIPKNSYKNVNLQSGLQIKIPANGILFFTTLDIGEGE